MKRILRNWRWIARGGLAVGLGITLYMVLGPAERWNVKIDENVEDEFEFTADGARVICQRLGQSNWCGPSRLRDAATGHVVAELPTKHRTYEAPCIPPYFGHVPLPNHLGKRYWVGLPKNAPATLDVLDLYSGEVYPLPLKPIANRPDGWNVIIAQSEDTMAIVEEEASTDDGMAKNSRGVVHLFALPSGEHLAHLDVHYANDEIPSAHFALDGSLFLYSAPKKTKPEVHIWDAKRRCKVPGVIATQTNLWRLSPNGRFLLATGSDNRTKIWDLLESECFEPRHVLPAGFEAKGLAVVSRDCQAIATWTDEEVVIWDRKTGETGNVVLPPRRTERAVGSSWAVFSRNEAFFAVIRVEGESPTTHQLTVIDVLSRKVLWSLSGCHSPPLECFGAHNTVCVVLGSEAQVRNAHSGEVLAKFRLPGSSHYSVLSENGQFAQVRSVGAPPEDWRTAVFTFLNKWLNAGIDINNSRLLVIDLASHREVFDLINSSARSVQLSEDGRTLLTVHDEEAGVYLRCWDVPARRARLTIVGMPAGMFLLLAVVGGWRDRRRVRRSAGSAAA